VKQGVLLRHESVVKVEALGKLLKSENPKSENPNAGVGQHAKPKGKWLVLEMPGMLRNTPQSSISLLPDRDPPRKEAGQCSCTATLCTPSSLVRGSILPGHPTPPA